MRFLPLVGVMTLIFLLSHTPGKNLPEALNGLDKLWHALAYASLGGCGSLGLVALGKKKASPFRGQYSAFLPALRNQR